jgi:plastocyanin
LRAVWRVFPSLVLTVLLTVLAATATACGDESAGSDAHQGSPSPSGTPVGSTGQGAGKYVQVAIEDYGFSPAKLDIKTGTTVVWTNRDSMQHTVTSTDRPGVDAQPTGAFVSVPLDKGGTFQYMFDSPGVYHYECSIHASRPSMHAKVVVTE